MTEIKGWEPRLQYLEERSFILKRTILEYKDELAEILEEIVALTSKFKVGDRVCHRGKIFIITKVKAMWGDAKRICYVGKSFLKNGELEKREHELYGEITLASKEGA